MGYLPDCAMLYALDQAGADLWQPVDTPDDKVRFCAGAAHDAWNWLLQHDSPGDLCRACALNRTIPDLSNDRHWVLCQRLETVEYRLVYSLLRLGLPLISMGQRRLYPFMLAPKMIEKLQFIHALTRPATVLHV